MEIEAKFRIANPETTSIQTFTSVIEESGFQVDCLDQPIKIVDTYFDTNQHALQAKGAAIRLRRKADKTLLTYKRRVAREGALHSRVELEAEPEPDHLRAVFSELQDLGVATLDDGVSKMWRGRAEQILGLWTLIAMLEISTDRCRCEVSEGNRPVAIFVLDQVSFERGERQGGYVGVEVEAIGEGNTSSVITIAKALKARLGENIQEQDISKYEFAIESLA